MSTLVLDAAALIAFERKDSAMRTRVRLARVVGLELRTTGVVVAEVWREPAGGQSNLARLLRSVDVRPVDQSLGRRAVELLGQAKQGQAADATLVAIADHGDRIVTSDPNDISALVRASGCRVAVVAC